MFQQAHHCGETAAGCLSDWTMAGRECQWRRQGAPTLLIDDFLFIFVRCGQMHLAQSGFVRGSAAHGLYGQGCSRVAGFFANGWCCAGLCVWFDDHGDWIGIALP